MTPMESVATIASLWLVLVSTCCLAWPTPYRRSYQYYPPIMSELGPPNQWDIAQEPLSYDQPEDYFDNTQWTDIEALSNLIDMYDNSPPVWGQIVNERPEEELQELKRSMPLPYAAAPKYGQQQQLTPFQQQQFNSVPQQQANSNRKQQGVVAPSAAAPQITTSTPKVLEAAVSRQPPTVPRHQVSNAAEASAAYFNDGQKEVALLRPPMKPKATPSSAEPDVISAQLTSSERQKKPSPYDTLRKYLSIEDALKKEAEKRRADSRHQKRSNFVAEDGTLTGQLNNLKKSMA